MALGPASAQPGTDRKRREKQQQATAGLVRHAPNDPADPIDLAPHGGPAPTDRLGTAAKPGSRPEQAQRAATAPRDAPTRQLNDREQNKIAPEPSQAAEGLAPEGPEGSDPTDPTDPTDPAARLAWIRVDWAVVSLLVVAIGVLGARTFADRQALQPPVRDTGAPADRPAAGPLGPGSGDAIPYRVVVNVNEATWQELTLVPGIGATTAQAIVARRDQHGPFPRLAALEAVHGIGPRSVERWRPYLTLTARDHEAPPDDRTGSGDS